MGNAPELAVTEWLNTDKKITLESLRGRVVLIEAFQMLCPGCVSHGLPLATEVVNTFSKEDVVVLGLHTVFEHHDVQGTQAALNAFLHEYRIKFPVGIDAPSTSRSIPQTMARYDMQGTPTTILIDRDGVQRAQYFGRVTAMALGAHIGTLLSRPPLKSTQSARTEDSGKCTNDECPI